MSTPRPGDDSPQVGLEALADAARLELARIYSQIWSPEYEHLIQQDAGWVHLRLVAPGAA